jgi:hypothetical protein
MGGYGSSRWHWHDKKATVWESLSIDLADLHKSGWLPKDLLTKRVIANGNLKWFNSRSKKPSGNINIHLDTTDTDNPYMQLMYTTSRDGNIIASTNETVRLSYTLQKFGGKRAWLHCPQCDKRTRSIHCPPDAIRFLCRTCHDLSYVSAQQAHKWDRGAMLGLRVAFDSEARLEDLYSKLRKTRLYRGKRSKANKRLRAEISKLLNRWSQHLDTIESNYARQRVDL